MYVSMNHLFELYLCVYFGIFVLQCEINLYYISCDTSMSTFIILSIKLYIYTYIHNINLYLYINTDLKHQLDRSMRQCILDKDEIRELNASILDYENTIMKLKALSSQMDSTVKMGNERVNRLNEALNRR